jgi:hypothetical protein
LKDIELPACPDCGNSLVYAAKVASIERNHLRLLRCRYLNCNRTHGFSFDGTVRLVDTLNSDEAPAANREAEEDRGR